MTRNLKGLKFGRLYVVDEYKRDKNKGIMWLCKCDCGKETIVRSYCLLSENTKSCGCLRNEESKKRSTIHNKSNSRIYYIWCGMKSRCYNKRNKAFKNYGGRGINICDYWKSSFLNFANWSENNGYNEKLTIERIDVNGNYEPNNCKWCTYKEQNNNRRNNHLIEFNGKIMTLNQWSEKTGIGRATILARIDRDNWDIKRALTTPVRKIRKGLMNK